MIYNLLFDVYLWYNIILLFIILQNIIMIDNKKKALKEVSIFSDNEEETEYK